MGKSIMIIIFLIFLILFGYMYMGFIKAEAYYKGSVSENFDGLRFKMEGIGESSSRNKRSTWRMIAHFLGIYKIEDFQWEKWDVNNIKIKQAIPDRKLDSSKIRAYFINHSTILLQIGALNILTDPMYSYRAGILWLGPTRVHEPGIGFDDLPKIDIVLISHSHYDHLDKPTLERIFKRDNPLVITPYGNDHIIKEVNKNFRITPLLWGEKVNYAGVTFNLVKSYHWTKRTLYDDNKALWGGFIIEANKTKIYFAGDTSFGNENGKIFYEMHEQFGDIDLAFIPIGAYLPRDFMKRSHTNPEDAVNIHKILRSKKSVGIHWGTFQLSAEKYYQPLEDLTIAKNLHFLKEDEFIALNPGEHIEIINQ